MVLYGDTRGLPDGDILRGVYFTLCAYLRSCPDTGLYKRQPRQPNLVNVPPPKKRAALKLGPWSKTIDDNTA